MKKSQIIEVSQIMVHSLQPYNYLYTKFEVLYKNGNPLEQRMLCDCREIITEPIRIYDENDLFLNVICQPFCCQR